MFTSAFCLYLHQESIKFLDIEPGKYHFYVYHPFRWSNSSIYLDYWCKHSNEAWRAEHSYIGVSSICVLKSQINASGARNFWKFLELMPISFLIFNIFSKIRFSFNFRAINPRRQTPKFLTIDFSWTSETTNWSFSNLSHYLS